MTPKQKSAVKLFVPETLLYGALAASYCYGVVRLWGHFLQTSFHDHRVEYAGLTLGLMIFQGLVLERATHWFCSLFRPKRTAKE